MIKFKHPPKVSADAFELYHECVSQVGLFFLPLRHGGDIRVWCFDPIQSQIPWAKLRRHKTELYTLANSCDLPFPTWLKTAMRHNRGHTPTNNELELVFSALAFRMGVTVESVRLLAA